MKPTLLVLAAGMGSRYGGLKQMDAVGPNGETIMDYSIYDAIRAGFGKVIFVIRKDFEQAFRNTFANRFGSIIVVDFVFQSIDKVPAGCTYPPGRTKPWGTNHAVMMSAGAIKEPFAVINADDFYGQESFEILCNFLKNVEGKKNQYCMVGYHLGNTLSESGAVSRGICDKDSEGNLVSVVEYTHIERLGGTPVYKDENSKQKQLDSNALVSMNMWGFTPDYFDYSEKSFKEFLAKNGENPKSEFYIPIVVDELIRSKTATVKMLPTTAQWFGVTYSEDKPAVMMKINDLVRKGAYPEKLWK
ncbi:MAG: nucleotidyltransferase [Prevotellaceae bacterium]|jgi:NDP-sugar pyrophosphorylase family protein|nr:nucleotidyltransferase [Prevotellaceae bacterium]